MAFGRPWRQTEGLLRSPTVLLGVDVGVSDHTTFSRQPRLGARHVAGADPGKRAGARGDRRHRPEGLRRGRSWSKFRSRSEWNTSGGEWLAEKHGERGTRTWRKLHLAVDPHSGEILASELTSNEDGDASQVSRLLERIPGLIASAVADGAMMVSRFTAPWLSASPTHR